MFPFGIIRGLHWDEDTFVFQMSSFVLRVLNISTKLPHKDCFLKIHFYTCNVEKLHSYICVKNYIIVINWISTFSIMKCHEEKEWSQIINFSWNFSVENTSILLYCADLTNQNKPKVYITIYIYSVLYFY